MNLSTLLVYSFNREIKTVCSHIFEEIKQVSGDDSGLVGLHYVRHVLFYRFIMPSMVDPRKIVLFSKVLDHRLQMHLVPVAKLLHTLTHDTSSCDVSHGERVENELCGDSDPQRFRRNAVNQMQIFFARILVCMCAEETERSAFCLTTSLSLSHNSSSRTTRLMRKHLLLLL